ncbi:thiosulfate sulfurtransferase/rhodanese-like domain-containing protein 3 [Boleophthalmus pectinirostris]|uniref:thiosulfate sulfurtransferase/rhodanese-like domain-containing protein 3 n=1 Tax=Boleophthalmus pectinirostris TaxID=150288 RepID=UPI000A1C2CC7|nr:thiosulfate sulfurtransferase/rhodanese-like domain-containing protein 3 [Boleophthalmus pectinirostris]
MAHRICWRVASVSSRLWRRSPVFLDNCFPRGQIRLPSFVNSQGRFPSTRLFVNRFSATPLSADVSYEELKQIVDGRNKAVIIDVREPWELREYGAIPGSINVPLGQINTALRLEAEEFLEKYGGKMPQLTDSIVFTCLAGVRSLIALETANSMGYKSVQHYPGGWQEWMTLEQKNAP